MPSAFWPLLLCLLLFPLRVPAVAGSLVGEGYGDELSEVITDDGSRMIDVTEDYLRSLRPTSEMLIVLKQRVAITADLELSKLINFSTLEGPGQFELMNNGVDLTIHGAVNAPFKELFLGEGHVHLMQKYAKVDWFGAKADAVFNEADLELRSYGTKSYHGFRKALAAVKARGRIEFGYGGYAMIDTSEDVRTRFGRERGPVRVSRGALTLYLWYENGDKVLYDSVEVYGQGMGKTYLLSERFNEEGEQQGGIEYSPTRGQGWNDTDDNIREQATYTTTVRPGQNYLVLKDSWMNRPFTPGQSVFVRNGGNGFDQDNGQPNVVKEVRDSLILFEYPFQRDLSLANASSIGGLSAFTMPPEQGIVQVEFLRDRGYSSRKPPGGRDKMFSYGNNLFQLVSDDGDNRYTIRNVGGKSNDPQGTQYAANALRVMKSRTVFTTTTTLRGAWVRDMSIRANYNAFTISNFIDCGAERVHMLYKANEEGGLTLNGDGGLNFSMKDCVVEAAPGQWAGSQIARSMTNFVSEGTQWINIKHAIIEFSEGTKFINDKFLFDYTNTEKTAPTGDKNPKGCVAVGLTTGNTLFRDCEFVQMGGDAVVANFDINQWSATAGGRITFEDCYMNALDVDALVSVKSPGLFINGLRATGVVTSLFGGTGSGPLNTDSVSVTGVGQDGQTAWAVGGVSKITDFEFIGSFDQVFNLPPESLIMRNSVAIWQGFRYDKMDNSRVVDGLLVSGAGRKGRSNFRSDVEMEIHGMPLVTNVPAVKFDATMNSLDRFEFTLIRPKLYFKVSNDEYRNDGVGENRTVTFDGQSN
ncbi:hypothetical protein [Lewinella sp. IMCC34191]|uniref:hypothetical protein n=1 Tax=Lewinella sp. IMCC34191 TaxID=2259172 RepID=UPI001300566D|nr:hypothetical protein [Lewinella sp. IMCC34191]